MEVTRSSSGLVRSQKTCTELAINNLSNNFAEKRKIVYNRKPIFQRIERKLNKFVFQYNGFPFFIKFENKNKRFQFLILNIAKVRIAVFMLFPSLENEVQINYSFEIKYHTKQLVHSS